MNQELKRKWVKALLSGKYAQTRGELKDRRGYCCLGVLRDVADKNDTRTNEEDYGSLLSKTQLREFGLTQLMQDELSDLNDGGETRDGDRFEPVPFEVIAGLIDEAL